MGGDVNVTVNGIEMSGNAPPPASSLRCVMGYGSAVEQHRATVWVTGSNPVAPATQHTFVQNAVGSSVLEHSLGLGEVGGSNPSHGT